MAVGPGSTVGREPELARLEGALDALDGGALACLAARGRARHRQDPPAGRAARRAPKRAGTLVLGGAAAEFERDLPFGVWIDALDAYVPPSSPRASWDRALLDELAGVLPSLRRERRAPDDALADERYRAHRAVQRLLEQLADDAPLGARARRPALERRRLDRADRRAAAPRPERARAAGARASGAARRRAGSPPRSRCPHVQTLRLDPLSREAGGASCWTGSTSARWRDVYAQGGGNPFYLEQLARAARRAGRPRRTRGQARTAAGVPAAVAASLAEELASLAPTARALLDARRRRGRAVRARPGGGDRRAGRGAGARRARRPARARARAPDARPAPLRLPPPADPSGGLRVDARRLAAGRARARRRDAGGPRRRRRRARPPRRAVGAAGRRGRDRAAARGRRGDRRPRPRRRRALVRGGAAAAAGGRPRAPVVGARRARLGAALARRAGALPHDPAGGGRAGAVRRGRLARRADDALRGRRALARAPRRRAPAPASAPGRSWPSATRPRARRCRSSWPSTASTSWTSRRRSRWAAARWRPRSGSATAR